MDSAPSPARTGADVAAVCGARNYQNGYLGGGGLEWRPKCPVCSLVDLASDHPGPPHVSDDRILIYPTGCGISVYTAKERVHPGQHTVDMFTMEGEPPCDLPFVYCRPTREETWPSFLGRSMERCGREHPECVAATRAACLPTRVLDLGVAKGKDQVRLYVSSGEEARFTALSYCWGGKVPITTTKATLEERCRGILDSSLPATFQDAIAVTRELGVRYLWIDALCILQDDKEDWEIESSRMASIYRGAALVIGASMAPSSVESILHLGTPEEGTRCFPTPLATVENNDGSVSTVYVRNRENHDATGRTLLGFSGGLKPANYGTNHLSSRAWTLQEQLLASRMMHFLPDEIIWECRSGWWCECMDLDPTANWDQQEQYRLDLENQISKGDYTFWRKLITFYIDRQITYGADFLPALSGVVAHLQQHGAGECLAGVWRRNLLVELTWLVGDCDPGEYHLSRAVPYRAPTWSWASLKRERWADYGYGSRGHGAFQYLEDTYARDGGAKCCRVVVARCDRASKDPNGVVDFGYLVLTGRLLPLHIRGKHRHADFWLEGLPDKRDHERSRYIRYTYVYFDTEEASQHYDGNFGFLLYKIPQRSATGLVLRSVDLSASSELAIKVKMGNVEGLVELAGGRVYKRVGVFTIEADELEEGWKKMFAHASPQTIMIV
ncbi:hypothetical protein PspLS_04269 [Pyricularia sp. CBS 133598]|nr:hypothetical protein PspLS_04269 [Pyricularia sp. CBS 133598]